MHKFNFHIKSCLLVIILLSGLLSIPSCRFLEEQGLYKSRALKQAILWAKQDSARVADSLKRVAVLNDTLKTDSNDSSAKKAVEKNLKDSKVKIKAESPSEKIITGKYHIIAGSFSNEENAKIRARQYFSKGYTTDIIEFENKSGGKVSLVSVKSFDNLIDANDFLKKFKLEIDSTAWLYTTK